MESLIWKNTECKTTECKTQFRFKWNDIRSKISILAWVASQPPQSVGNLKYLIHLAPCTLFIECDFWVDPGDFKRFFVLWCLPVRKIRRLHTTEATVNLTEPNNHPNSALLSLSLLYSGQERESRAVLRILCTETAKAFAFRNHAFLPSKTNVSNPTEPFIQLATHRQLCYQAWLHELPPDWTIVVMACTLPGWGPLLLFGVKITKNK